MTDHKERLAVSPKEAASLLGVSIPTVYDMINTGRLPSVKIGSRRLIAVSELHRLLETLNTDD